MRRADALNGERVHREPPFLYSRRGPFPRGEAFRGDPLAFGHSVADHEEYVFRPGFRERRSVRKRREDKGQDEQEEYASAPPLGRKCNVQEHGHHLSNPPNDSRSVRRCRGRTETPGRQRTGSAGDDSSCGRGARE